MTRPPARDQPSDEETAALHAELVRVVHERRRLSAASIVRGPGFRRVHVLVEGDRAWLALLDLGQVLAERTVETRWLLEQLGGTPRFEDLARLLDET